MGFGWQEIDKTLDLGYIRVAGLHHGCNPAVLFDPPNFRPRTMTHNISVSLAMCCWHACRGLPTGESYRSFNLLDIWSDFFQEVIW